MRLELETIMQHLDYLHAGVEISEKMLLRAQFRDVEEVDRLSMNRQRLMAIISKLQSKIEENITRLNAYESAHENYSITKSWAQDVFEKLKQIGELDTLILEELQQEKVQTSKQISSLFKAKEQFKGYNLNSTKR